MKICGLIIAAGLSDRMDSFKPILELKGKPLIQLISEKLSLVCDEVIIVTGYKSETIENVVKDFSSVRTLYNAKYEKGMFTSLKKGLENLFGFDWIIYHFVDQPALPEMFYTEFVQRINPEYNWIQPSYKNVKGHPILLAKEIFDKIINSSDENSLKEISKNPDIRKLIWDCEYQEVLEDIDTREDFNKIVMK